MLTKLNDFFRNQKQIWVLPAYGVLYLLAFRYLEQKISLPGTYHLIICPVDKYIPFCEYFVIFYLSWFLFMLLAYLHVMFVNKSTEEFYRFAIYLCTGMTLFLFISCVFPNGLNIRPVLMPRDNVFTDLVRNVYRKDTPTNVFPSIHCYNSAAIYLYVKNSRQIKNRFVRPVCLVWAVLIILSTVFIKQHSMYDVIAGTGLAVALSILIYQPAGQRSRVREAARVRL